MADINPSFLSNDGVNRCDEVDSFRRLEELQSDSTAAAPTAETYALHRDTDKLKGFRKFENPQSDSTATAQTTVSSELHLHQKKANHPRITRTPNKNLPHPSAPMPIPKWIDIRVSDSHPSKPKQLPRSKDDLLPLSDLAMILSRQLDGALERGLFCSRPKNSSRGNRSYEKDS